MAALHRPALPAPRIFGRPRPVRALLAGALMLVVIALGLGILLRRTRLGLPGGMLAAAMPGLLAGDP